MKPKNFPGRKNDRRKRALRSLNINDEAYKNTLARIVPDQVARGIRTKKNRSARASLRA